MLHVEKHNIEEIPIFDIRINPLRRVEFLALIESAIINNRRIVQFGVNSATINDIMRNDQLRETINNADLVHIDGMSVVWALRWFGYPIPERVATPDLAEDILAMAARDKLRLFLFGAKEEILQRCLHAIVTRYPDIEIAGVRNGYYSPDEEEEICQLINSVRPDILFLGMSSPKKELFFEHYRNSLQVSYILGVGGYFDIVAGQIKRAPLWMQNAGLEWAYRLWQEPGRLWKRYLFGIFQFGWLVAGKKIRILFSKKQKA